MNLCDLDYNKNDKGYQIFSDIIKEKPLIRNLLDYTIDSMR